jgi:hypothetical protein
MGFAALYPFYELTSPYGDPGARRESDELALRMRRCGVSRWHPDPARECERIEAERPADCSLSNKNDQRWPFLSVMPNRERKK